MTGEFAGRRALVTGAGKGLGRAYALGLARHGARVVVNDVDESAAAAVVDEIHATGGEAISAAGSVADAEAVAEIAGKARDAWGGVDILINNAGILRDRTFAKMTFADWTEVMAVHLNGAFLMTKAFWDEMRDRNYGRILMTTSSSGLFGNFGQSNYAAAKMGLVGLAKTLSLEGARAGIRCNCIAPIAATAMTETVLPEGMGALFAPEYVVPAALFLVGDNAPTGAIVSAGGGRVHASHVTLTRGVSLRNGPLMLMELEDAWGTITSRDGDIVPESGVAQALAALNPLDDRPGALKVR